MIVKFKYGIIIFSHFIHRIYFNIYILKNIFKIIYIYINLKNALIFHKYLLKYIYNYLPDLMEFFICFISRLLLNNL